MEKWDLFNSEGVQVKGTMVRGEPVPEGLYHMVVHIIIKNSKGEYLIQKRADDKDLWPGQWAFTGGSATSGEHSELTAIRELGEETGIDLELGVLEHMTRVFYSDYFSDIWSAVVDVDPETLVFQVEEVSALAFESEATIIEMLKDERFHHYSKEYLDVVFQR